MDGLWYVPYFACRRGWRLGRQRYHEELLHCHRGERTWGARVVGRSEPDCWRNRSCLVDGFWYVRYFAFVVEGDEDGSGIMKSCFVVIM